MWNQRAIYKLRETVDWKLTEAEWEEFLRARYKENYSHFRALYDGKLYPMSARNKMLHLYSYDTSGPHVIAHSFMIEAPQDAPTLWRGPHNSLDLSSYSNWREGLPTRLTEVIDQALSFNAAIKDVSDCAKTYKRARYVLSQWTSSAAFMPNYVRKTMQHRRFVRPVPKKIQLFKPETLQTLALMSLIEPYPENT